MRLNVPRVQTPEEIPIGLHIMWNNIESGDIFNQAVRAHDANGRNTVKVL